MHIPLPKAVALAAEIARTLAPGCEAIVPTGALRRHRATIQQIDLACLPRYTQQVDLFGTVVNTRDDFAAVLDALIDEGWLTPALTEKGCRQSWSATLKIGYVGTTPVRLLSPVAPDQWGTLLVCSAAPERWLRDLRLPEGWVLDGRTLTRAGGRVPVRDEAEFFALTGVEHPLTL